MSVIDQFKNLFAKKPPEEDKDSRLSLAMPDESMDGNASETVAVSTQAMAIKTAPVAGPAAQAKPGQDTDLITLPFLGQRSLEQHQRLVGIALGASLLVLAGVTVYALSQSGKSAQHLGVTAQALTQSQRLAKSATLAMAGNTQAVADVGDSSDILAKTVRMLAEDEGGADLEAIAPLVEKTEKNARAIMDQQKHLAGLGTAVRQINGKSAKLLELAQTVSNLKVQQSAAASEVAAAGQLIMLTQRMGKLASDFLIAEAVTPDAAATLTKDMTTFKEVTQALLSNAKDAPTRDALEQMLKQFEDLGYRAAG